MLETLTSADFQPLLHQTFQLTAAPGQAPISVELVEVADLPLASRPPETGRRPFSLIFCDAQRHRLPQQIYAVEHDSLGRLDLFLVPVGPAPCGMQLQAIFA